MKRLFLVICVYLFAYSVFAQENEKNAELNLSVDVASGFVWRGVSLNSAPVVMPEIALTVGKLTIGAWASVPFTPGEYQELDIFASLQLTPSLSIGLADYFDSTPGWWSSPSYFNYKKEETSHTLDLLLIYDGEGSFPLKFTASTIIAGADLKTKDGERKRNFSSYFELGYGNTTRYGIDWEVFAGFVPMKSEYYGIDDAAFTNIGFGVTRYFEITPTYSLPLSLRMSVNPAYEAVYFTAAIGLF